MSDDKITQIIASRGPTHGNFLDNADISQGLKMVMKSSPNWDGLPDLMKESLEQDALKSSRILSGNPFVHEHWNDKSGYAQLVVRNTIDGIGLVDRFAGRQEAEARSMGVSSDFEITVNVPPRSNPFRGDSPFIRDAEIIGNHLVEKGWFQTPGAYVLVDGQYGSTGKGVIAGLLGDIFAGAVALVTSNAGPNSGHTNYVGDQKVVLKQLPTFAVTAWLKHGVKVPVQLNAGAVINLEILDKEINLYRIHPGIHPSAALIDDKMIGADQQHVVQMASTGQGVGPALMRKLSRVPEAVVGKMSPDIGTDYMSSFRDQIIFVETSQGFSLGINSGFYPHVTTRECTVSQALSDANLPPTAFRKSIMAVRTFPIRVGDTENSSGPCYKDQREISWEELGQEPEFTTVTKRVRRVFTWSAEQFRHALLVNQPDAIFCNFCNYLPKEDLNDWLNWNVAQPYYETLGRSLETLLAGFGPKAEDVALVV